jgi:cobalt/nickel transport system permease protein
MVDFTRTTREISGLLRDFLAVEEFASRNGFLQAVNQKVKLVGIFLLIALAISTQNLLYFFYLLLFSLLMVYLSKIPMRTYLLRFGFIPLFAFIIVLPWIFMMPGHGILSFFGIKITREGIVYVVTFGLRVTACVSCITLILFTTRVSDLLNTLRALKIPETFVEIIGITYRYLFSLLSELQRMFLGRESRTASKISLWRTGSKIAANFMLRTLSKGEEVHKAMRARGYNGKFKTYPRNQKWTAKSITFVAIIMVMVGIWLVTGL